MTGAQRKQMEMLLPLYSDWNNKINVISRKDIENLYLHHVLHSLAIARIIQFTPGTRILDVGTGGGFPGIALAIMFPEVSFCLIDSIGKKIRVVQAIADELGLHNVSPVQARAEDIKEKYDFITSRAVTTLQEFIIWTSKNIIKGSNNKIPNGILYLKGGDLSLEIKKLKARCILFPICDFFSEDYFREKFIVYISPFL